MTKTFRRPETVLLSGHARFPQECPAKAVYDIFSITVEVETSQWTIINLDVNLITDCAKDFLRKKLMGRRLLDDGDAILSDLEVSYYGGAKKALLAAVTELCQRIAEVKNQLDIAGGRVARMINLIS